MLKITLKSIAALVLSSAFWLSAAPLSANPMQTLAEGSDLSTGHVLSCNTPDEVEAFVASHSTDAEARLVAVNSHFGKQSCNIVTVAFYKTDDVKVILVPDGVVRIVKLNVVGVETEDGWQTIEPMPQFVGVLESATMV
jgi:ApbE superfamily uncharacterized protein (UPF0280 family)